MALKFYWRCESATFAAQDYSAGDTTPTNSNQTYGTDGAKIGTNGLIGAVSVNGSSTFDPSAILANSADIDTSVGAVGYWWKAETTFPGNGLVNGFRTYVTSTTRKMNVQSVTGSKLKFIVGNPVPESAEAAPATALSANLWYFIVARWDVPGDKIALEIYTDAGGSSLTLVDSAETTSGISAVVNSTDMGAATWGFLQFNVRADAWAQRGFTDNVILCDTYSAPIQNNAFITDYASYSEGSLPVILNQYRQRWM